MLSHKPLPKSHAWHKSHDVAVPTYCRCYAIWYAAIFRLYFVVLLFSVTIVVIFRPLQTPQSSCAHTTMESNQPSKGFSIYQFIFFVLMLNAWAVHAAYHTFVDDPEQRNLCREKTSESACSQDEKCGWNDIEWLCNEALYQPDFQHCDVAKCPGQDCLHLNSMYILRH